MTDERPPGCLDPAGTPESEDDHRRVARQLDVTQN
jgi:hypothetical protein